MALVAFGAYILASGVLSFLFLTLVWLADRYEREPPWLVFMATCWGAVPAVLVSCTTELVMVAPVGMSLGQRTAEVIGTILVAPPVEEIAKGLALLLVVTLYRKEFDDVLDGLVYGAAVGIGFSFAEDAVYFAGAVAQSGLEGGAAIFALRNLAFALNHSLFTAFTGIGFGVARVFNRSLAARIGWPLAGLFAATALHAAHNALAQFALPGLLAAMALHWAGGLGLLALVPFLWAVERRWIVQRLGHEVSEGFIPLEALRVLPFSGQNGRSIPVSEWSALRRDLVELAFHRRSREDGWAETPKGELDLLRARIRSRVRPS